MKKTLTSSTPTGAAELPARIFAFICIAVGALGQTGSFTPPPGDLGVFGMFLEFHDSLMKDIEAMSVKDPLSAQATHQHLAKMMGISTEDFVTVNSVYRALKVRLDALTAEAATYTKNGTRRDPDMRVLLQFVERRKEILNDGRQTLQSRLSPASWKALYAYVDGEYRKQVQRTPVTNAPVGNTKQSHVVPAPRQ